MNNSNTIHIHAWSLPPGVGKVWDPGNFFSSQKMFPQERKKDNCKNLDKWKCCIFSQSGTADFQIFWRAWIPLIVPFIKMCWPNLYNSRVFSGIFQKLNLYN
jgi:hypothetical protein